MGRSCATNPQTHEIDEYCTVLAQEFQLYPPGLIRRSRFEADRSVPLESVGSYEQKCLPSIDPLYLDVLAGRFNQEFAMPVTHINRKRHNLLPIMPAMTKTMAKPTRMTGSRKAPRAISFEYGMFGEDTRRLMENRAERHSRSF